MNYVFIKYYCHTEFYKNFKYIFREQNKMILLFIEVEGITTHLFTKGTCKRILFKLNYPAEG